MALTTICKTTSNLFAIRIHRNVTPRFLWTYRITTVPDRRLFDRNVQKATSCSNGWSSSVRHTHWWSRWIDLDKYNFPIMKISLTHRMMLKLKMLSTFDTEEFFTGVIESFLYTTECIAHGHSEALQDSLTDEAKEDIPTYIVDAESDNRKFYIIAKEDISQISVTEMEFKQVAEFQGFRDVKVLYAVVWIAYMKDIRQHLQMQKKRRPPLESYLQEILLNFTEKKEMIYCHCYHAQIEFQRAYDEELRYAMTDWIITHVQYKLPTSKGIGDKSKNKSKKSRK